MGLLPAAEDKQIIVDGQRKSGGGGGCAQCDQKGGISTELVPRPSVEVYQTCFN